MGRPKSTKFAVDGFYVRILYFEDEGRTKNAQNTHGVPIGDDGVGRVVSETNGGHTDTAFVEGVLVRGHKIHNDETSR